MTSPQKPSSAGSLASAAAFITVARTVQMVVVFLLSVPLSRLLDKFEYGTYMHVTFLSSVVPVLVAAPLGKLVVFFLPRTTDPAWLLRRVAAFVFGAGLLAGGLLAVFPAVLAMLDPEDSRLVLNRVLIGTILAVSFPYAIGEQVLLARGVRRGWGYVLVAVAFVLLVSVGGALAFAPESERLVWCLRGLLTATVVQSVVVLVGLLRPLAPHPAATGRPTRRELLGFLGPVALATAISVLAVRMDGFAVPRFFGEAAKSSYYRGAMEPPVIGALAFTLLSLTAPELAGLHAGRRGADLLALWRRTCRMVAVLTIPIVGMVEAVAEDLFLWVYPIEYTESVAIFRWFTAGMIVRIFLPQVLLENTGAARATTSVAAFNLLFAGILLAVLLALFGWQGAAPAMVIGTLGANWLLGGWLAKKHLGVGFADLLDWNALARLMAAGAVAWGVTHLVMGLSWCEEWTRLSRVIAGSGLYAAAFALAAPLTGAVTSDDVSILVGALRGRLRRG